MKFDTNIEKGNPGLLKADTPVSDISDSVSDAMWDGHGFFVAVMIVVSLTVISLVAVLFIDNQKPQIGSSTSSKLIEQSLFRSSRQTLKIAERSIFLLRAIMLWRRK